LFEHGGIVTGHGEINAHPEHGTIRVQPGESHDD
jgi:hypothetical protein